MATVIETSDTNLPTTPATIDGAIHDTSVNLDRARQQLDRIIADLHKLVGDTQVCVNPDDPRRYRRYRWQLTTDECLTIPADQLQDYQVSIRTRTATELDTANDLVNALTRRLHALNALYTGWTRYWLCTNDGGHIHRSMSCSSCRPTTRFNWLTELSGLTEAEAVAIEGGNLCSQPCCFESAPVEYRDGSLLGRKGEAAEAEKAAKAAARDAKAAIELAKQLLPTGKAFEWTDEFGHIERVQTIAAARAQLTDLAESDLIDETVPPFNEDEAARRIELAAGRAKARPALAAVLAERTGETVEHELAEAARRAKARSKKWAR